MQLVTFTHSKSHSIYILHQLHIQITGLIPQYISSSQTSGTLMNFWFSSTPTRKCSLSDPPRLWTISSIRLPTMLLLCHPSFRLLIMMPTVTENLNKWKYRSPWTLMDRKSETSPFCRPLSSPSRTRLMLTSRYDSWTTLPHQMVFRLFQPRDRFILNKKRISLLVSWRGKSVSRRLTTSPTCLENNR